MDTSIPTSEQYRAVEPRFRVPKPSKACVPCRARKVKCDAAVAGLPCSSCTSRHCAEACVLSARKRRTKLVNTDAIVVWFDAYLGPIVEKCVRFQLLVSLANQEMMYL